MAMLDTLGQVVKEARRLLQDEVYPYRYGDGDLVDALNTAILDARRLRPDLFLPKFVLPYYEASVSPIDMAQKFPVEPSFRPAFIYYIVGRMETRDDEQTQDGRAVAFLQTWRSQLVAL
jgi:hypothetical protein